MHCVLGFNNCLYGCYSIATTVWHLICDKHHFESFHCFQPQQHIANRRLNMHKSINRGKQNQTQLIRTGYCRCTQRSMYSESSLQRTACKPPAWRQKLAKLLWTFSRDIPSACLSADVNWFLNSCHLTRQAHLELWKLSLKRHILVLPAASSFRHVSKSHSSRLALLQLHWTCHICSFFQLADCSLWQTHLRRIPRLLLGQVQWGQRLHESGALQRTQWHTAWRKGKYFFQYNHMLIVDICVQISILEVGGGSGCNFKYWNRPASVMVKMIIKKYNWRLIIRF